MPTPRVVSATATPFVLAFTAGALATFAFLDVTGIVTAGPGVAAGLLVIALSAGALGLQAVGTRRIAELAGVRTTMPHDFTDRRDGRLWLRLGSAPALLAGVGAGTAVVVAVPAAALLISAIGAIAAVTLVRRLDVHRL